MPGIELPSLGTQDGQEPALSEEELSHLASSLALEASLDPGRDGETRRPAPPSQANPALSQEEQQQQSSDDLIPSGDPCHHNLKLRNVSVDLLQRITARTVLQFILSLLDGEDLAHFVRSPSASLPTTLAYSPTRHSVISSVSKNRDSFARQARSETQLIIAQSLLMTRAQILEEFESDMTDRNPEEDNHQDEAETPKEENEAEGRRTTLEERLNEQNVSRIVEDELKDLIRQKFTDYSHPFIDHQAAFERSISLVQASELISFSAQVLSWNRLFDLLFSSHSGSNPPCQ
ncbi:uncharacterized protein PGTG_10246 [Puccinia graminis f. sp. tritici CRL 75-36-700-3]|uniref:Uncharacterized protein n=1 Tax=Puccinia graminis f. sp. tritici (strain CRL 75-36-700-3 / race SCCL) TaxID=418459 RepID=E3KKF0_PUCGT|nr:uncharacterized protein PGTG_10246 [Puccinia graminis f. sp. tritici CRL 75-36-700-3]EFP84775.1 hypothetical protein PGTG_10246 [Puccinia graminis f. sp. tritici CRL 75-36-700-3]